MKSLRNYKLYYEDTEDMSILGEIKKHTAKESLEEAEGKEMTPEQIKAITPPLYGGLLN